MTIIKKFPTLSEEKFKKIVNQKEDSSNNNPINPDNLGDKVDSITKNVNENIKKLIELELNITINLKEQELYFILIDYILKKTSDIKVEDERFIGVDYISQLLTDIFLDNDRGKFIKNNLDIKKIYQAGHYKTAGDISIYWFLLEYFNYTGDKKRTDFLKYAYACYLKHFEDEKLVRYITNIAKDIPNIQRDLFTININKI